VAHEGLAMWLASRAASAMQQRAVDTGTEASLMFED